MWSGTRVRVFRCFLKINAFLAERGGILHWIMPRIKTVMICDHSHHASVIQVVSNLFRFTFHDNFCMASDDDRSANNTSSLWYQLNQFLTIGSHVCDKSGYKRWVRFFWFGLLRSGEFFPKKKTTNCRGVEWATELQHFFPQSLGHQQWIFWMGWVDLAHGRERRESMNLLSSICLWIYESITLAWFIQ